MSSVGAESLSGSDDAAASRLTKLEQIAVASCFFFCFF